MIVYATRHGQTEWNALERICGRTDLPLDEAGTRQARTLGQKLAADQVKIDRIIASPLLRAQQTAGLIAEALQVSVETDARLIEQNYGIYEGEERLHAGFLQTKKNFAVRYPGGESMMQVACRVYGFLEALKLRDDLETVLLVSHGGTLRVLNTYFEDVENQAFFQWQMENTQLLRYTL